MPQNAQESDFAYFDPPYTVAHAMNGFIKYNEKIFSWEDQIRLAQHARTLANRGCRVLISNADHPSIHELYHDFECELIERFSVIAAKNTTDEKLQNALFIEGATDCYRTYIRDELGALARVKVASYHTKSVHPKLVGDEIASGWEIVKAGKTSVRLRREKLPSINLEDRVWSLLYKLKFDNISAEGGENSFLSE